MEDDLLDDDEGVPSVQTFDLAKHTELRVECSDSKEVTLRLEAGTAEIFGAELQLGVSVNVTGQKLAVFTFHGATVRVEGRPVCVYQADETPMAFYLNTHAVLMARREEALQKSSDASSRAGPAPEVHHGPRVIVVGPQDSGKSTLCRMLANWAVRAGFEPTLVDLDVGQGSITVPGCIAATPVEAPIDVEEGFSLDMPLTYFFGHTAPADNPELYQFLVERLANILDRRAASSPKVAAAGLIINTIGQVEGLGYDLQRHAIEYLKADVVIVLEQDRLYSQLVRDFKSQPHISVIKLPKSGGVVKREREERRKARDQRIREYFSGPRDNLSAYTDTTKADKLMVYRIGGGAKAPNSALPIGAMSIQDPLKLHNLPASTELIQSIMAVSHAATPDQILSTNVAGFILVKEVDMGRGIVSYTAPCPGPLPGRYLITGSLRSLVD